MKLARFAMFCGAVFVMVWLFRSLPAAMTTPSVPRNIFDFAVGMLSVGAPWACSCAVRCCRWQAGIAGCGCRCGQLDPRQRLHCAADVGTALACITALRHGDFLCELCAGIGHLDCKFTEYAHGVALRRAR